MMSAAVRNIFRNVKSMINRVKAFLSLLIAAFADGKYMPIASKAKNTNETADNAL